MSNPPFSYTGIGIGHGANWAAAHSSNGIWPPGSSPTGASTPGGHNFSDLRSTGTPHGGRQMNGGAAHFRLAQGTHYYRDIRGEWEDDDF